MNRHTFIMRYQHIAMNYQVAKAVKERIFKFAEL